MPSLLSPIDFLGELAGADFAPDPAEYGPDPAAPLDPGLAPPAMPGGPALDPVLLAGGPPVAAPGPQGADELANPTWRDRPLDPLTYRAEDAYLPPPTTPYG